MLCVSKYVCFLKYLQVCLLDSVSAFVLFLFVYICLNMSLEYITDILGFIYGSFRLSLFGQTVSIMREFLCVCAVFKTSRRCNLVSGNGFGKQPQKDLQAFLLQPCLNSQLSEMVLLSCTDNIERYIRVVQFVMFKLDLIDLI